ncbi:hypothetical protein ABZX75_22710 [Streptomyces sp. NPDC003038]|uniref:hypothetical protein n=1 Tax=unclassified Streptomyces TaxID=2593676 RepID=UPI0033B9C124
MPLKTGATALPRPFEGSFQADPYKVYAQLREAGSVHRVALPDGSPVWLVTHEADVRQGLVDPRLSVNKRHSGSGFKGFSLPPALDANLLNIDADDHLRLRRLVSQGFTPRRVQALRSCVQAAVDTLVDQLAERVEADGRADVVTKFARPLPLKVIGDLLAVPGGGSRHSSPNGLPPCSRRPPARSSRPRSTTSTASSSASWPGGAPVPVMTCCRT